MPALLFCPEIDLNYHLIQIMACNIIVEMKMPLQRVGEIHTESYNFRITKCGSHHDFWAEGVVDIDGDKRKLKVTYVYGSVDEDTCRVRCDLSPLPHDENDPSDDRNIGKDLS
jgi:hypothetical protein